MKNGRKEIVISIVMLFLLAGASWFISLGLVRACANAFAKPDPQAWEWVYISTSPRAYSYHQKSDCKYLRKTTHNIEFVSVDEADEAGRTPCSYCLEESRRHQYDKVVWFVVFPVAIVLLLLIYFIERICKRQKTSRKRHKMYPMEHNTEVMVKLLAKSPTDMVLREETMNAMCKNLAAINNVVIESKHLNDKTICRVNDIATIMINSGYVNEIDDTAWLLNEMENSNDVHVVKTVANKVMNILWDGYLNERREFEKTRVDNT